MIQSRLLPPPTQECEGSRLALRFLIPFMLSIVVFEQALRIGVGHLKPLAVDAPPPGAFFASCIVLLLAVIALLLSLRRRSDAP